jgi:hypothetical protein
MIQPNFPVFELRQLFSGLMTSCGRCYCLPGLWINFKKLRFVLRFIYLVLEASIELLKKKLLYTVPYTLPPRTSV